MDEYEMYLSGMSIPEVHEATDIALSTLRFRFNKKGILRSRADGVRLSEKKGRNPHKGKLVRRVVMAKHLGRKLRKGEIVHHLDENKSNNHSSNLELNTRSAHATHHAKRNYKNRTINERGQFT